MTLLLGIIGMLAYYLDPRPGWTAALIDDYSGGPDLRPATAAAGVAPVRPRFYRLRSPNVIRLSRFLRVCRWAFLTALAAPALLPAIRPDSLRVDDADGVPRFAQGPLQPPL